MRGPVTYHLPRSVSEALGLIAQGRVRLIAGGTDVFPSLGERPLTGDVVDLTRLEELRGISREEQGFRIGALTTWSEIVRAELPDEFRGLKLAAREVGSVQIQNVATVAGNLCNASPAADGVPALMALDAVVEVVGPAGTRHVEIESFITGVRQTALSRGEIVTAVHVPKFPRGTRSAFRKLGARRYLVISIAAVAALLVPDGSGRIAAARVAVGACSPVARRLEALERALAGLPWRRQAVMAAVSPEHLSPLSPIDDIRAPRAYRLEATAELVRRALADCIAEAAP
jgi:CO/xanthine dehydrogenase FAD-binding subunit